MGYLAPLRVALPLGIAAFAVAVTGLSYWNSRGDLLAEITQQSVIDVDAFVTRFRSVLEAPLAGNSTAWERERVASLSSSPNTLLALVTDGSGRILTSTRPALVGQQLTNSALGVAPDVVLTDLSRAARTRTVADPEARRITAYVPVCRPSAATPTACGTFVYQESLARAYSAALSAFTQQVVRESIGVCMLAILLWLGLHFGVTRRVGRLIATANAFAAGERDRRSQLSGADEIAQVSGAFDSLLDVVVRDERALREQGESLERQVKLRTAEAERAAAYKSRLLAMASHDLRQPLQTARLLNATLRRQADGGAETQDILRRENLALMAAADLTDTLLNVAKLESGSLQPQISEFALGLLVAEFQGELAELAQAKGLALHVHDCDVHVRSDRTLLRQIVQNLLTNAIRYTDRGSVTLHCRSEGDRVVVEVRDTGIGIPADELDTIFEEFYQVRGPTGSGRGGLGLGLSIVRRLATMLGLQLAVQSTLGAGTTFAITIDAVRRSPVELVLPAAASAAASQRPQKNLILLIEDDDAVRMATALFLRTDSYEVQQAAGLDELGEQLNGSCRPPSLVISDFHLGPEDLGTDAIALVRKRFGDALPAIVLTGDTSPVLSRLRVDGHTRILNKPVDVEKLSETIRVLIAQSRPPS